MGTLELVLTAIALSMDAFAVAICKGLSLKKVTLKNTALVGAYFGIFQAGMPLLGYLVGKQFETAIKSIDHWIAFFLLGAIGVNMLREALSKEQDPASCEKAADLRPKAMLPLAVATSIDALAVGITLAFLRADIVPAVSFIGTATFFISMAGVKIGSLFGRKYKAKAELCGGAILILIGLKILLEHLQVLSF